MFGKCSVLVEMPALCNRKAKPYIQQPWDRGHWCGRRHQSRVLADSKSGLTGLRGWWTSRPVGPQWVLRFKASGATWWRVLVPPMQRACRRRVDFLSCLATIWGDASQCAPEATPDPVCLHLQLWLALWHTLGCTGVFLVVCQWFLWPAGWVRRYEEPGKIMGFPNVIFKETDLQSVWHFV